MAKRATAKLLLIVFSFITISFSAQYFQDGSLSWSPGASALATIQDDGEEEEEENEDEEDPELISDKDADGIVTGIVDFFSRRRKRNKDNQADAQRLVGGTLQCRITDWAGRPTDGVVRAENGTNTYIARSTGGRATIVGVRPGEYTVTLDPVRDVAPPPVSVMVQEDRTSVVTLRTLEPNSQDKLQGKVDLPKAPLPGRPKIPGGRDLGEPPKREALPERDLGRGDDVVINGFATDTVGRPIDALIVVSKDGTDIGYVRSVASRFSIFDLEPGETYDFRARGAQRVDGPWVEFSMTLGYGISRLTVRMER